jgi:hypothetical protein
MKIVVILGWLHVRCFDTHTILNAHIYGLVWIFSLLGPSRERQSVKIRFEHPNRAMVYSWFCMHMLALSLSVPARSIRVYKL